MAEEKEISTITQVIVANSLITIFSYYQAESPAETGYIYFFITNLITIINTVSYEEGELGYTNDKATFSASVNSLGELIVVDDIVSEYWISDLGELMRGDQIVIPPTPDDSLGYYILTDPSPSVGTGVWRICVRDHLLRIDVALTALAFNGTEDVDWKNVRSKP
jgi:hypothetical protein